LVDRNMGRPPLWAYYKDSKPEDCIDKPATRFNTSLAQMFDEDWDKYYKDLDPDMARYDRATDRNNIKYARDNIKISFSDTTDHRMYLMCAVCKKVFNVDDPDKWGKIEGGGIWKCNDHKYHAIPVVKQVTHTFEKEDTTKYKRLGSPDIYAVAYHDTGHIIKTAEDFNTEEIKDIREADSQGKFPVLNRRYNKQIR
jgi:hypothetical protein